MKEENRQINIEHGISVVINTYNASQHLAEVLETVKDFDEVVICDMESTDNTLDTARKYGCKIVIFPRGNYQTCEPARQTAIDAASCKWVLVVDADELVTPGTEAISLFPDREGGCSTGFVCSTQESLYGKIHALFLS